MFKTESLNFDLKPSEIRGVGGGGLVQGVRQTIYVRTKWLGAGLIPPVLKYRIRQNVRILYVDVCILVCP